MRGEQKGCGPELKASNEVGLIPAAMLGHRGLKLPRWSYR